MSFNKIKKQVKKSKTAEFQKLYLVTGALEKIQFSEAKGRDWRFRSFARLYLAEKYDILITGHTATDQSETALLQLIRGTSFYGMTRFQSNKKYKGIFPKYPNYSLFLN